MNTYETTILVPGTQARADYDGAVAAVREIYEVEGATFTELDKWEERKLAYPIKGETNATYLTGYFQSDSSAIVRIERRAELSDVILRQLIIARPGKDMDKIVEQRKLQVERQAERERERAEAVE